MLSSAKPMFCSHCGQALQPGAQFCGSCGRPVDQPGVGGGLNEFLQGFVSVSLKEVVLFNSVAAGEILKSPVFRFLCLFALTPLAIKVFESNDAILNALGIWSGVFWALLVFRLFADRELHFGFAVGMVLFTAFIMLPMFEFYLWLPPQITEWLIERELLPLRFIGFVFGVGLREEMCKAVPLIALAFLTPKMKNPLNGLVLGMMSGIGFAISENVYYVHRVHDQVLEGFLQHLKQTGTLNVNDFNAFVFPVYNNVIRMMTGPFGHSVYSGIFGYFISLAAADRGRRVPLFLAGLSVAAFLHGTYDTFASPIFGTLIKAFNFFVLMTYILKARGLTSAKELAGGMFSRTVVMRAPQASASAEAAPTLAPPPPVRPAAPARPVAAAPARPAAQPKPPIELRPVAAPPAPMPDEQLAPTLLPRSKQQPQPVAAPLPSASEPLTPPEPMPTLTLDALVATWRLKGVGGPVEGQAWPLEAETKIGRDSVQCRIHLAEPMVSRQHALVSQDASGWRIRRLSTTGPLYVNGQPVDEAILTPGAQIQVGNSVFLVESV